MTTLVNDPEMERSLREQRAATGADRYDEVWEGTYMMAPMPNDEHQELVTLFGSIFQVTLGSKRRASVRVGVNVSDRKQDWQHNYRVPDVAVFLEGGRAENCGAFWYGGPDFAVEVVSPGDRTGEKLLFYATAGVRELLVVDREPWRLMLYRPVGSRLALAAESALEHDAVIGSIVLPFTFRLITGPDRPQIEVIHTSDAERWLV